MNKLVLNKEFDLFESKGKVFCDSLMVAESFKKEHKHVIEAIEGKKKVKNGKNVFDGLINQLNQSDENSTDYFIKVKYKDSKNRSQPKYLMTRDATCQNY